MYSKQTHTCGKFECQKHIVNCISVFNRNFHAVYIYSCGSNSSRGKKSKQCVYPMYMNATLSVDPTSCQII